MFHHAFYIEMQAAIKSKLCIDIDFINEQNGELEEASTHKSAKTHAGTVFVTRDLDLLRPK